MLIIVLITAIVPGNLAGFWHSEHDLSEGYRTCCFLWDTGEFAYLESIEDGTIYMGNWYISDNELVLDINSAIGLDGSPVSCEHAETKLALSVPGGKSGRIVLDGKSFYLLNRDPQEAIISLVPTFGMTNSERSTFSTYD